MTGELPAWLAELTDEDLQFLRRLLLSSGSLKELARIYSVSYPTVRARLDRLIAKVQATGARVAGQLSHCGNFTKNAQFRGRRPQGHARHRVRRTWHGRRAARPE